MRFRPMKHDNRLDFEPFWNALAAKGVKTIVFDATSSLSLTPTRVYKSSIGTRSAMSQLEPIARTFCGS